MWAGVATVFITALMHSCHTHHTQVHAHVKPAGSPTIMITEPSLDTAQNRPPRPNTQSDPMACTDRKKERVPARLELAMHTE